jgi:hypothetical protein
VNISKFIRTWLAARADRRIARLTALASDLDESQHHDLLMLQERGFVSAKATGQTITQIGADVENRVGKKLHVAIKPGTYFVSTGNYQNMVTRKRYTFTLYPNESASVNIEATCINASLPVPTGKDRFRGVKCVRNDIVRFLEASQDADPMVVQAGVWTLTDNYTAHDIQNHLVCQDRFGNRRRAVSDEHIAEARRILDQLNLNHRL